MNHSLFPTPKNRKMLVVRATTMVVDGCDIVQFYFAESRTLDKHGAVKKVKILKEAVGGL